MNCKINLSSQKGLYNKKKVENIGQVAKFSTNAHRGKVEFSTV
jgi:hypothetical protein